MIDNVGDVLLNSVA